MFRRPPKSADQPDTSTGPTAEEESAYEAGLEEVREEKRRALLDPGPSWRTWFLHDNSRWWFGVLFMIFDSWILAAWFALLQNGPTAVDYVGLFASMAVAIYLEYVAWLYLWHRPSDSAARGRQFRRTWWRPFEFGRWTAEAELARSGQVPVAAPPEAGPDPREFL